MTPPANPNLAALLGAGQLQAHPVPTQAQVEEVRRVQGLQIRTNAANMATNLLQGTSPTMSEWTMWARGIEAYIVDEH